MDMTSKSLACPKGKTRKQVKAKKRRTEAQMVRAVRGICVGRDVYCRVGPGPVWGRCDGPSEMAHILGKKRSRTRNMAACDRHDYRWCAMLCRRHHRMEESGAMVIRSLSGDGANGPLSFDIGAGSTPLEVLQ